MRHNRIQSRGMVLCHCSIFVAMSVGLFSVSHAETTQSDEPQELAMVEIPLEDPASGSGESEKAAPESSFPAWPERRRMQLRQRERVPPPPPGPYMSTALSTDTVRGPTFGRSADSMQEEGRNRSMEMDAPMDLFSPDRPWPTMRMTDRWEPAGGYHYVEPMNKAGEGKQLPQAYPGPRYPARYSSSGFDMGNRSYNMPSMTWTGPGSNSGVPSVNMYPSPRNDGYYPPAGRAPYGPYPQYGR